MALSDAEFQDQLTTLSALADVSIVLTRVECLILLTQLQLATKHPLNTGSGRELAMKLAQTLENAVSVTPQLRAIAAAGWR